MKRLKDWFKKKFKEWFRRNFKRKMTIPETIYVIGKIAEENDIIIHTMFFYHRMDDVRAKILKNREIREELFRITESIKNN